MGNSCWRVGGCPQNPPAVGVISGGLLDRWEFCAAGQPLEEAWGFCLRFWGGFGSGLVVLVLVGLY